MPHLIRSYYKIRNLLKSKRLLNRVSNEMDEFYEVGILKNEALKIIEIEPGIYGCPVCKNPVLKKFQFCPHCSQKLKK